jgi:hypothetical protein
MDHERNYPGAEQETISATAGISQPALGASNNAIR